MSTSPPRRGGGLQPFRLGDVPEGIRLRGKEVALRREDSPLERLRIGMAAENPSPRVYWISRAAWERVTLPKNQRRP